VTCTAPRLAHSLTRVVLPNPAGAETSVKLPFSPPASCSSRRGRGTRSGRGGGRYSLVARRDVLSLITLLGRIAVSYHLALDYRLSFELAGFFSLLCRGAWVRGSMEARAQGSTRNKEHCDRDWRLEIRDWDTGSRQRGAGNRGCVQGNMGAGGMKQQVYMECISSAAAQRQAAGLHKLS
jgi:hypothetical protein